MKLLNNIYSKVKYNQNNVTFRALWPFGWKLKGLSAARLLAILLPLALWLKAGSCNLISKRAKLPWGDKVINLFRPCMGRSPLIKRTCSLPALSVYNKELRGLQMRQLRSQRPVRCALSAARLGVGINDIFGACAGCYIFDGALAPINDSFLKKPMVAQQDCFAYNPRVISASRVINLSSQPHGKKNNFIPETALVAASSQKKQPKGCVNVLRLQSAICCSFRAFSAARLGNPRDINLSAKGIKDGALAPPKEARLLCNPQGGLQPAGHKALTRQLKRPSKISKISLALARVVIGPIKPKLLSYQKLRISLNDSILHFIVATTVHWAPTAFGPGKDLINRDSLITREVVRKPRASSHKEKRTNLKTKLSNMALRVFLKKKPYNHLKRKLETQITGGIKKYLGLSSKWLKGLEDGLYPAKRERSLRLLATSKVYVPRSAQPKRSNLASLSEQPALAGALAPLSPKTHLQPLTTLSRQQILPAKGYYSSFIIKGYGKRAKRSKSLFLFKIGIRKQSGTLPKQIIPKSLFIKSKKKRTRFKFFSINKQVEKSLFNKIIKLQGSSKKLPAFSYKDIGIRIFGKKIKKKVRRV